MILTDENDSLLKFLSGYQNLVAANADLDNIILNNPYLTAYSSVNIEAAYLVMNCFRPKIKSTIVRDDNLDYPDMSII